MQEKPAKAVSFIRYCFLIVVLAAFPAVVYIATVWYRDLGHDYLFMWLPSNYLYMATPHWLTVLVGIVFSIRRVKIILTLTVLDVVLIIFQAGIFAFVTPRESGLAWVLYIPVWMIALVAVYIHSLAMARRASA